MVSVVLEWLLWLGLGVGLYPYLGYPLIAHVLSRVLCRPVVKAPYKGSVTVVIAAYNEAGDIEKTVRNKLDQEFDGELEVIVASDGSTDGTDEAVAAMAGVDARVKLVRQEPRQGKTAALNRLVALASGEIIVFSDANSLYRRSALRLLLENFADPEVGYVTGKMVYVDRHGSLVGTGCSAYMRYENALRERETRLGSIVGVDGGIDAVRRCLYRPMGADQIPDFVLPLSVREAGYRVVYEPRAELTEESLSDESSEFRMRVRVGLRSLWALRDKAALLSGAAGALFAWQLWSHKALRYFSPVPLLLAAVASLLLAPSSLVYLGVFAGLCAFCLAAWAGRMGAEYSVSRLAYYFVLMNAASLVALWRFARGHKVVIWQPRTG